MKPGAVQGTVTCGSCGSRLCITRTVNRHGAVYLYYFCIGRQKKRSDCDQPVVATSKVETLVEDAWSQIAIDPEYGALLQEMVQKELDALQAKNAKTERSAKKQLDNKREQRRKLLEAYYAGALTLELFKAEQEELTSAIEAQERRLVQAHAHAADFERMLKKTLEFLYRPQEAYLAAPEKLRRQLNQAVWEQIEVHVLPTKEHTVTARVQEPFATLLKPDLLEPTDEAVGEFQRQGWSDGRPKWLEGDLVARQQKDPRRETASVGVGLRQSHLAPPTGFEPVLPP